jgi:hypothetical protein
LEEVQKKTDNDPEGEIRYLAQILSSTRDRPCLLLVQTTLRRSLIPQFLEALDQLPDQSPVDILIVSHGGCIDTAYVMARALGRRRVGFGVFVPLCAKSAATLLALAAEDIIMGPLGELGPLDAQFAHARHAQSQKHTSELALFAGLREMGVAAIELHDAATTRVVKETGLSAFDASDKAASVVNGLFGRIYDKVDPMRMGEGARALEFGQELGRRVLARHHPEYGPELSAKILRAFQHDYPCHGFPIDYEELVDLGVPVKPPTTQQHACLDRLGRLLLPIETEIELCELVDARVGACDVDFDTQAEAEAQAERAVQVHATGEVQTEATAEGQTQAMGEGQAQAEATTEADEDIDPQLLELLNTPPTEASGTALAVSTESSGTALADSTESTDSQADDEDATASAPETAGDRPTLLCDGPTRDGSN